MPAEVSGPDALPRHADGEVPVGSCCRSCRRRARRRSGRSASALSPTPAEFCDHSWLPVAVRPAALPGIRWTTP